MANPWRGEVTLIIDGQPHICRLTLGALAELEVSLRSGSLIELIKRFEAEAFSATDVLALLLAGLRGGGWHGDRDDLIAADIAGGPLQAARVAAQLLAHAFALPDISSDAAD